MDYFVFCGLKVRPWSDLDVIDHQGVPPWMKEQKGTKADFLMQVLENTMKSLKLSDHRKRYIRHRVWMNMFDSVGEYYRVCEIIIPTLGVPFDRQDEYDLPEKYRTKSMDFITVQGVDFKNLKVREKLNGSVLHRHEVGDEVWLVGMGSKFLCSGGEVELLEYTENGLFNLRAHRVDIGGVKVDPHPYVLYDQRDTTWAEGYVMQYQGEDYKVKRIPTIEIERGTRGAWEVAREKGKWVYLWPRPGKSTIDLDKAELHISQFVSVSALAPITVRPALVGGYDIKEIGDVFNMSVEGTEVVRSSRRPIAREVVSSKVVLFDDDATYLLDEKGKMLDLVGGKVEMGEDSYEAISRESVEETGILLNGAKKLGIFQRTTQGVAYTTFIYLAPLFLNLEMDKLVRMGYADFEGTSPWVKEMYDFVKSVVGSMRNLRSFWSGITERRSLPVVPKKQIDVQITKEDVLRDIVAEKPLVPAFLRSRLRDQGFHVGRRELLRMARTPGTGLFFNAETKLIERDDLLFPHSLDPAEVREKKRLIALRRNKDRSDRIGVRTRKKLKRENDCADPVLQEVQLVDDEDANFGNVPSVYVKGA